jgi:hypothetical protein
MRPETLQISAESVSKCQIKDELREKVQISFLFLQAILNKILYIAALFLTPAYRERYD